MTIPITIAGIAYDVPETVITNDDLSKLVETSDEWITTRTGIKERRIASGEEDSTLFGINAAKKALKNAKIKPEELDLIIAAASIPRYVYPSCACLIQGEIGAKNAAAFDVSAACSGLIYAMNVAKAFIEAGIYKNILIVASDTNSKFVDWTDRSICVLFGDGAGAIVLKKSDSNVSDIVRIDMAADGTRAMDINIPFTGKNCPLVEPNKQADPIIYMNGKEVYKFVVTTLPDSIAATVENAGLKPEDINYLVPHQANLRIIDAMAERLGYNNDKVIVNIDKYGNTSAASIMIALCEGIKDGKVKLPCKAIFSGFGAGMTYANAIVNLREGIY